MFNYFPSKESLLSDDFDPVFIQSFQARPASEPILSAFRQAMQESMLKAAEEISFSLARSKLIRSRPPLQAAAGLERERDIYRLAELLAERTGMRTPVFELHQLGSDSTW